ncbi:sarcoplasmic calcium-binding protein-like, partial [Lingula anatina]|uniref:Sarcoplasmic calcium-binding protein-like n=1 Tax=Lingula anatina TaxID=7574 RepID=A0A2R2MNB9_LINAN
SPHDYPVVAGSEHWKRKVRTFFRAHDVDRDGYLTKRDFEMTAHRIAAFMNLDDKSAQDLLKNRLKIWEAIVQGGDPDSSKVSEEVYFSNLLASLNSNFRDLAVGFVNNDFDTMDLDGDGFISPKEHRAFFYGFGIPTEHSAAVFEAFDIGRD